jgi:hypothetical protein
MVAAWREKRRNVWHGEMLKWAKEMRIERQLNKLSVIKINGSGVLKAGENVSWHQPKIIEP